MSIPPDDVIATRHLELRDDSGAVRTVEVRIGRPRRGDANHPGNDFYCECQVEGVGTGTVRVAWGVDEVQALLHAIQMAGYILSASDEATSGRLTWLGQTRNESNEFGFPIPPPSIPSS